MSRLFGVEGSMVGRLARDVDQTSQEGCEVASDVETLREQYQLMFNRSMGAGR